MDSTATGAGGARFRLMERDAELETLRTALSGASEGRGRLLLCSGPAGVGKSRLLAELRGLAAPAAMPTLHARCLPLEQEFSFGTVLALFERRLVEAEAPVRGRLLGGGAASAAPLFEGELADGFGAAGERDRLLRLLHGLFWLVANLAAEAPLLLTVDDAHWADLPTLHFLNFLAPRLEELPVLLAVGVRDGEARPEAAALLAQLEQNPGAARIRPDPLSPAAVGELLRAAFPGAERDFCAACAGATEGNPFLVGEVVDELRAGRISPDGEGADSLSRLAPAGLRRSVVPRLRLLHGDAIALAGAVAVLADDARLRHAAALAGLDPAAAGAAADALAGAGILEFGSSLRFVHPLIASSVYAELPPAERRRLHREAAELLAAEQEPAERLAAQLLPAVRSADPWAVQTLRAAAAAAIAKGAPASAARYLARALEEPPRQRSPVLLELGRAHSLAGDGAEAVSVLAEAVAAARDDGERAAATHALGSAQLVLGRLREAAESFAAAAELAAGADRELALRSEADLVSTGLLVPGMAPELAGRLEGAIAQLADGPLSPAGRAILATGGLLAVMSASPVHEALALAERALDEGRLLAEEGPDSSTIWSVTGVLSCSGENGRSIEVLDQVVEAAVSSGSVLAYATAVYCRSYPQLERGNLREAIADARAALDARRQGWAQFLPAAYMYLVRGLIERGELAEAEATVERAAEHDWDADLSWALMFEARGRLALAQGNPGAALSDFRTWGERWSVPNPAFYCEWRSAAALAAARLGDREQASELAREELALVEGFGSARSLGIALRSLGVAEGGERGAETLRQALAHLDGPDTALERCRAAVLRGEVLRRDGRPRQAREQLKEAVGLAQRIGAKGLEQRASGELKLAGGRPRGRRLSGVESLSAGELRVARMAAEGMTNREIAQALFVTPKAVQWHLGNTYRKLAVNDRELLGPLLEGAGGD